MATEVEYINYKEFVEGLSTTENPDVTDKAVVCNETDGPRAIPANTSALSNTATDSDLTATASIDLQTANGKKKAPANLFAKQSALETTNGNVTALATYAQNVAHSIAPEFDPTRDYEHAYPAGESVTYIDGKTYVFKVDHYGPWVAADVKQVDATSLIKKLDSENNFFASIVGIEDVIEKTISGSLSYVNLVDAIDFKKIPANTPFSVYVEISPTPTNFRLVPSDNTNYRGLDKLVNGETRTLVYGDDIENIKYYTGDSNTYNIKIVITQNPKDVINIDKVSFTEDSVNLFNVADDNCELGKYILTDGSTSVNANYNTTGFMKVEAGKTYVSKYQARTYSYYNSNFSFQNGYYGSYASTFTPTSGQYYLRLSIAVSDWNDLVVSETELPEEYVPFGRTIKPSALPKIPYSKLGLLPNLNQAGGLVGFSAESDSDDSLAAGSSVTLSDAPKYLKKGYSISAEMSISSFSEVTIGNGGNGVYRSAYFVINSTNVIFKRYESSEITVATKAHGLNISSFLKVALTHKDDGTWSVVVSTLDGFFATTFDAGEFKYDSYGTPFVKNGSSVAFTDVKLNYCGSDFQKAVWFIGDSYLSLNTDARWPYQLKEMGYFDYLICALPGAGSSTMYDDLVRCLNFGCPKFLVWCLGMNDASVTTWRTTYNRVVNKCNELGITLITATIPTTPSQDKEAITAYVRSLGTRTVDFYKSVGTDSSGQWYTGYLSADNVHPTKLGAKALASQVLVDVPEVMQYQ